ncbi:hypothetical protein SNA_06685 [Streptomyces natalensis ATCC 27448]|uniref:Uncharacterized protein n=1 Tax=Streptomyces natalensis ATCC 27448 TaxID=1240678 RepID=A0A0D7CRQ9_9ACTN|nr:hypothetical protein SNA_06685 [Streptomyces natalensis ATCC 27448]
MLAGAALPLVATAPAHADPKHCASYLHAHGYVIGPKVAGACAMVAMEHTPGGKAGAMTDCNLYLFTLGVKGDEASTACQLSL